MGANRRAAVTPSPTPAVLDRQEQLEDWVPGWSPLPWQRLLSQYVAFVAAGNHRPAPGIDDAQTRLNTWMRRNRRLAQLQGLSAGQISHLDEALPGWLHDEEPDVWGTRLWSYLSFVADHARRPSPRSASAKERTLAIWMARNLRMASAAQLDELDKQLPGWRSPGDEIWRARAARAAEWVGANGRMPDRGSPDAAEAKMARIMGHIRHHGLRPDTPPYLIDFLDAVLPGWNSKPPQPPRPPGKWSEQCIAFIAEHRRRPSKDKPSEQGMGSWLAAMRVRLAGGTLDPGTLERLDAAWPDWSAGITRP